MDKAYVYSYPHKLAYGPLEPPVPLEPVWAAEDRRQLFLYCHIPFCEMRCGFCNLFTAVGVPPDDYLDALSRQCAQMFALLSPFTAVRLAVGGGTPTHLSLPQLERFLGLLPRAPFFGIETSPATATPEKLRLLREAGVTRVSMGVQSFVEAETDAVHRNQSSLYGALEALVDARFPVLNLDLMVGLPGQTAASVRYSVQEALRWQPEELFVYPLYVRPQTRLYASFEETTADELSLVARDTLLEAGYRAVSRRMYVAPGHDDSSADDYRCQVDPMLGLGCGARSYTRGLHYSEPFAVGAAGVRGIIRSYCAREDYTLASWGYVLDEDEQARRHAVLSLLSHEGLAGAGPFESLVDALVLEGLVEGPPWRLTSAGRAQADRIGPRFFSPRVAAACLS